jgi:LuxR family transcriptional regulator, maltose regulon positive regulatory protein
MTTLLLTTKLYIPPTPNQMVSRTELVTRLEEGLQMGKRVTLITASLGYGKTSLVASWVSRHDHQAGLKFCWLSLDESDNDPALFWTYLLAALQTCQARLGESLAPSIWAQPNPVVIRSFLIGLVNEIARLDGRLVLVLDDFHQIQAEVILDGLAFFVEHLPVQLHLVLLSRAVPPLPLSRWRARSQITEMNQNDLRFNPAETAAFLRTRIVGVTGDEVQIIHHHLEGWPAGLQLTALAVGVRAQDGAQETDTLSVDHTRNPFAQARARVLARLAQAQSYLTDYLTDEVLSHQAEPVQAFLLRTSILEQLCPSLCDAMMETTAYPKQNHQALLAQLEKQNLFLVPLDPERKWFRYQRPFGELLQARLVVLATGQELQELHHTAAVWYHQQGFGVEAIHHALQGNDVPSALVWAEQLAPDFLHNGRINALLALMRRFPPTALDRRPLLSLYQARALMHTGQYASAWERIHSLEPQILAAGDRSLLAELANLKALLATFTRPADDAMRFASEALDVLPAEALVSRSQMHLLLGALHRLEASLSAAAAEILEAQRLAKLAHQPYLEDRVLENLAALRIQAGDYPGAEEILRKTVRSGRGSGFGPVCLAVIALEWDRLAEADGYLAEGLRMGEKSGVVDVLVNGYVCLSLLRWAQGDRRAAVEAFNLASDLSLSSAGSIWGPQVATERRWLQLKLSDAPELAALMNRRESGPIPDLPQPKYLRLGDQLITVQAWIANHSWQEALALVHSIETECRSAGLNRMLVEALLLKAIIYQAIGDPDRAWSAMISAVRSAVPDRFVRVFVNGGDAVQQLLVQCATKVTPEEAAGVHQLLSHFPASAAKISDASRARTAVQGQHPSSGLVEPLTAREQEVLELIAAGCTNREIAERLVTTENTIKKHTSHIFGKLMVSNRTQALVKAREFGLIP